jgi:sodium-dependent dicarboxylate transporter 2/3/5
MAEARTPGAPESVREITSEDPGFRFRPIPALIVVVAALITWFAPLPALSPPAHRTLVILVVTGGLWVTEALPVAVTALFVPVLGLVFGITDARNAFAGFGDPVVFLFFGAFLLTEAAARHGLNARLARTVLASHWVRERPTRMIWALALLGWAISAWVNNTATTALLLPLALTAEGFDAPRLVVSALLITSFAPSLGGLATPVGTAPNLIGLRLIEEMTGQRPTFAAWCAIFAPLTLIFTALTAAWLRFRAGRAPGVGPTERVGGLTLPALAHRPWSLAERTLVPVFIAVVLMWIAPGILGATSFANAAWVKGWQARLPEPAVPLIGALALFMLPSGGRDRARILEPSVFRRVDWATLLLFGGGLSLGAMMLGSGLARALGETIFRIMPIHNTYGIVLAATLMAVGISELTSNTASASLVVPVVLALAQAAHVDPLKPALAATAGCSFGFMLPVSTPPNALVFGTGRLRISDMIVNGLLLDILGVILVSVWVTLFI